MTKQADYSGVCVRVPYRYPVEHAETIAAIREQFPGVEITVGSVDQVSVNGDQVCDALIDVYEWTLKHARRQEPNGELQRHGEER